MAFDAATFLASLAGGTVGGTLLTAGFSTWRERNVRRGRARLLHEDLMHHQSTLARTFYRQGTAWWDEGWLLPLQTTTEDLRDLLAKLRPEEYAAVASALGWMDYLKESKKASQPPPTDEDLTDVYRRLASARYALKHIGSFEYRPHRHLQMKMPEGSRTDGAQLPTITEREARSMMASSRDHTDARPEASV